MASIKLNRTINKRKGSDGTNKHIGLANLYHNYAERLFKSFGVQSRVGGTGRHTGLKNRRSGDLVGSSFPYGNPAPGALI